MEQVADRIWALGGGGFNFYALEDRGRVTLIDAGLRGDWGRLVRGLRDIGRTVADVDAVLLTHAHRDHTGTAERLRSDAGAEVHIHGADAPFAMRGGFAFLPGVPGGRGIPLGVGVLRTLAVATSRMLAAWSLRADPVRSVVELTHEEILDVPGHPVVHFTPGHTPGSCVFLVRSRDVLFSGDAPVTQDMLNLGRGPQVSRRLTNFNHEQAVASLDVLDGLRASTLLPGHGGPWQGDLRHAVSQARGRERS